MLLVPAFVGVDRKCDGLFMGRDIVLDELPEGADEIPGLSDLVGRLVPVDVNG